MALPIVQKPLDLSDTRDPKDPNQQRQPVEVEDVELAKELKRLNNSLEMLTKAMVGKKETKEKIRNTDKNTNTDKSDKGEPGFFNGLKEFSKGFAEGLLENFGVNEKETKGASKARKIETKVKDLVTPEKTKLDPQDNLEPKQAQPKEKPVQAKEKSEKFASEIKRLVEINSKGYASLVKVTSLNNSISRQGFKNLTGVFQTNLDTLKRIQKEIKGLSLSNSKAFENVQKFAGSGGLETEGPTKAEERTLLAKAIAEELAALGIGGDAANGLGIPGMGIPDIDGPDRNKSKTNPKDGKNPKQPQGKEAPKGGGAKPGKIPRVGGVGGVGLAEGLGLFARGAVVTSLLTYMGNAGEDPQEERKAFEERDKQAAEIEKMSPDEKQKYYEKLNKGPEAKLNPKAEKIPYEDAKKLLKEDNPVKIEKAGGRPHLEAIIKERDLDKEYILKNSPFYQDLINKDKEKKSSNATVAPKIERSEKDKAEQLRLEKLFEKAREKGDSSSSNITPEKLSSLKNDKPNKSIIPEKMVETKNAAKPKENDTTLGMLKSSEENRQLQMKEDLKPQVAMAQPIVSSSTVNNTSQTLVPAKAGPRNQNNSMERYLDNIRFA